MRHLIKSLQPLLQKSFLSNNNIKPQKICIPHMLGYVGTFDQIRLCSTNKNDKKGEQIYSGILTPQIKSVKIFSLTTSFAGIIGQPIIYSQTADLGGFATGALLGLVGFFTFGTPLLLHLITKKYVTTMHYNEESDTYTATIITMFLTRQNLEFKVSDIVVPDVPGMFTTFIAKGKSLFVEPNQFTNPDHYIKLMGYDKPIDFKLNLDAEEYKNNKKEKE